MKPYQKLKASDGKEVMLFPLPILKMTQDAGGDFSHKDTKNIDIVGTTKKASLYAPCSAKCVAIWDKNSNNRVWQSLDKVHLADGTVDYVTFAFAHDDNPPAVNTVVKQGQIIAHTGTTGYVTGDHSHFNTARGTYKGYQAHIQADGSKNWDLKNSIDVWNCCYVNDTEIIKGYGHNWRTYDKVPPPEPPQFKNLPKRSYKFFLYSNIRKSI